MLEKHALSFAEGSTPAVHLARRHFTLPILYASPLLFVQPYWTDLPPNFLFPLSGLLEMDGS